MKRRTRWKKYYPFQQENHITQLKPYTIKINEKNHLFRPFTPQLLLNETLVNLQYPIQHKDILCIKDIKFPTLQQVADFLEKKLSDRIKVKFQHQEVELIRENSSVRLEDKILSPNDEIPNGSSLVWDETNNNHGFSKMCSDLSIGLILIT